MSPLLFHRPCDSTPVWFYLLLFPSLRACIFSPYLVRLLMLQWQTLIYFVYLGQLQLGRNYSCINSSVANHCLLVIFSGMGLTLLQISLIHSLPWLHTTGCLSARRLTFNGIGRKKIDEMNGISCEGKACINFIHHCSVLSMQQVHKIFVEYTVSLLTSKNVSLHGLLMAAQSHHNKKLYELHGPFKCSYFNLCIQFSISFILSMTIKLQSLRAEKETRCHFIDEKLKSTIIQIYN